MEGGGDLDLWALEAEIRRAEEYLKSDVTRSSRDFSEADTASAPPTALDHASRAPEFGDGQDNGASLQRRRPPGRPEMPEARRKEILAKLAQERGRGSSFSLDGIGSAALGLAPQAIEVTADDDAAIRGDPQSSVPAMELSSGAVPTPVSLEQGVEADVMATGGTLHRRGSSGGSQTTVSGGEGVGVQGGKKPGRYESDAAREALLNRLLEEYRQSKKKEGEGPAQHHQQGMLIGEASGQAEAPPAEQTRPQVPSGDGRMAPDSPEVSGRFERLLMDSPGDRSKESSEGGEGLFYASDLMRELEQKRQEDAHSIPLAETSSAQPVELQGRSARESREAWLPLEGLLGPSGNPPSSAWEQQPLDHSIDSLNAEALASGGGGGLAHDEGPQLLGGGTRGQGAKRGRSSSATKDRAAAAAAGLSSEFTFHPRVNSYERVTNKVRPPLEETLNQLSRPQLELFAERERIRREQEEEQLKACTFKPQLCKGTERRVRFKASAVPVPDRLLQRLEESAVSKINTKCRLEEEKMQECTFKPQINPDSVAIVEATYKPIHERLSEIQRAKRERLNNLRESAEQKDPDLTFQPRISETSDKIARERRTKLESLGQEGAEEQTPANPGLRLSRDSQRFTEQRMKKLVELEEERLKAQRQAPKLSKGTEKLVKQKEELRMGFLQRQNALGAKLEKKREEKKASYLEQEKGWYKPSIGRANQVLMKRKPDHAKENIHQRVERLSHQEKMRIERDRARRAEEFYSRYTFEPEINPVSQLLGRPSTTNELVHNWRGEMARVRAIQEAEDRLAKECTFEPQLVTKAGGVKGKRVAWQADVELDDMGGQLGGAVVTRPSKPRLQLNLRDPESLTADVEKYRREKEVIAEQALKARQIAEMQECTFHPTINRRRARNRTPVIVRGLGKYLETREHATRLQHDKEQRQKEVFSVRTSARRGPDGVTVVEPFRLSEKHIRRSKEAVKEEAERELMEACPFRPRTLESAKREALQRLLREEALEGHRQHGVAGI